MAALNDHDFDSMADYLLSLAKKVRRIEPPIDLFELAKIQRVTVVDLRPMLPNGGLSIRQSGFVIYIQNLSINEPIQVPVAGPVEDRPKLTTRQRFSMAHELAHTLLFNASDPPQLRPDAPKGSKLEALCHRAARRILMPPTELTAEVTKRGRIGAGDVLDLARRFDVSTEVVLRRCDELDELRDSDRALLYIRKSLSGSDEVAGFLCSRWFQHRRGRPELGTPPTKWTSGWVDEGFWTEPRAKLTVNDSDSEIAIARVPFTRQAYFVELERMLRDNSSGSTPS